MLWFKKRKEEQGEVNKEHISSKHVKSLLETARAGLNSQWFESSKRSILKELETTDSRRGIVDDKTKERAVTSILNSLEGAVEAITANGIQESLKEAADLLLVAYLKIGKPGLLDTYMDISAKAGMTKDEIKEKLITTANSTGHIDIAINLYAKSEDKERLISSGNKALNLYLEDKELDIKAKGRLFEYVVKAYKMADAKESLIQAGEKALKEQVEGHNFSHDKDWVFDAQKAYEAADDKESLAKLGDQYVNLYLKEGLEIWLDKGVAVYKESGIDYASKLGKLADRLVEKGHSEMADTIKTVVSR